MDDFTKYKTAVRALEQLENGNLKDAKRIAKRTPGVIIAGAAFNLLNWSEGKAVKAAHYLKYPSEESFDDYCNA